MIGLPAFNQTSQKDDKFYTKILKEGLHTLDVEMRKMPKLASGEDHSGSTAITAFVTPTHVIVGNVGDSRAVLARGGRPFFATIDHKPTDDIETARITAAGGYVEMGRVCGNLAVSRALGDYQYKDRDDLSAAEQKVTVDPVIDPVARSTDDQFLLLCCDGIWDVMSNVEAVDFVNEHFKAGFSAPRICELLIDLCLYKNSKDNMSVCLVKFPGAPEAVDGYQVPAHFTVPNMGAPEDETATHEFERRLSKRIPDA